MLITSCVDRKKILAVSAYFSLKLVYLQNDVNVVIVAPMHQNFVEFCDKCFEFRGYFLKSSLKNRDFYMIDFLYDIRNLPIYQFNLKI